MTRAEQCLRDRIRVHEFERARLVALRERLQADDDTVASLSAIVTIPAADLIEATIRPATYHSYLTKP